MGSLTNAGETAVITHLAGAAGYTPVATVYLALATADPTDAATGASMNEVANSGSYARKAITFGAAASRKVEQSGVVTFDAATGSWGTVSHWAITTSATHGAGTALAHGAFTTPKAVVSGNTPSVASAEIDVSFDAGYFSDTFVHSFLDLMFRNQAYSQPATKVALYTTTCSDGASGTEVTGGNYAQVTVNKVGGASPAWDTIASSATQNANAITFATATASWGTVVAVGLEDASGNLLVYDNATTDQWVNTGDTVTFAIGAFDISCS